ncbi:phytanoyl-CoA hydroxylase-interacting protein-like [Patella vulgata]|uniref:phytanoyl-CoA hydroxylase-interacting protein-like n=1 Tax=Patella vulgata TaxID=6465 RepID=UPI0024A8C631|nr:phytanoyl-CoA hydroxylase-interacting protein-like [Patella vulgata]
MRLESHSGHGQSPISVASDELKFNVDQRVDEMTNESSIIFTCEDVPLPTSIEFKYHYIQIIQTTSTTNHVSSYNEYVELTTTDNNEIPCVNLPSREAVKYKIYRVSQSGNRYHVTKTSDESEFITHNTMVDVNNLHRLALLANEVTSMPVPYLFRNKPSTHPTIEEAKETGIMTKYIKDNNGDQASCINKKINGLFFSATVDRRIHEPPVRSPFGDYRILVPPQYLLKFNSIPANIYFADFYCKKQGGRHHITLVLTKPGSAEDVYCKPRLLKLDINNNKFLYYDRICDQYCTDSSPNVEVLYTENIDLNEMRSKLGFLEKTVKSTGQSKPEGIPKNTSCTICNLPKNPSRI